MKKLLLTAIVALSAAVAGANDYIEHQIYSDKNFEQNRTKAIRMLEQRGYRVHDIDADDYRGRPVCRRQTCWHGETVLLHSIRQYSGKRQDHIRSLGSPRPQRQFRYLYLRAQKIL